MLFYLAVEGGVRRSGIQISGTWVNRLDYADDIDIMARSIRALTEAFLDNKIFIFN